MKGRIKMNITYTKKDGILYPNLIVNEGKYSEKPLSKYGSLAKKHLKEHNPVKYQSLILDGELMPYLQKIDEQARKMLLRLEEQYLKLHPMPVGDDFMARVQARQRARDYAEEIVFSELIYT